MSVQFAILLYVVGIELHRQSCSVAPNTVGLGGALKGEREPQWRCFIPSFSSGYKNDSVGIGMGMGMRNRAGKQ